MQSYSVWILEWRGQESKVSSHGLHVGRGRDNDIALQDDQEASRRHASVWDAQGVVFVRDEGSTNGTFVNGKRVTTPTPLRSGDRIQIGNTTLIVRQATGALVRKEGPPARQSASGFIVAGILGLLIVLLIGGIALLSLFMNPSPRVPIAQQPFLQSTTATLPSPSAPQTQVAIAATTGTQRALMATVEVGIPLERSNRAVYGSGSIVDPRGYILTNFHVVRDPDTERPYNSEDRIYVAVSSSTDRPPDRIFRAQVIALDAGLDLALLKLVVTREGDRLPADLSLSVIPLGNSDLVQIGDQIQVIGFPGLGGDTVTLTRGIVSGFLDGRTWIKTDTQINRGNSGGLAINQAGELIGIPTEVKSDPQLSGKIGLLRPVNLARAMIEKAK